MDGQVDEANSLADDKQGVDDEDGVVFVGPISAGTVGTVEVEVTSGQVRSNRDGHSVIEGEYLVVQSKKPPQEND